MKRWWSVLSVALPSRNAAIAWRHRLCDDRLPGNEVPRQKVFIKQDIYGTWRVVRKWFEWETEQDGYGNRDARERFRRHLDFADRHARRIIKGLK